MLAAAAPAADHTAAALEHDDVAAVEEEAAATTAVEARKVRCQFPCAAHKCVPIMVRLLWCLHVVQVVYDPLAYCTGQHSI